MGKGLGFFVASDAVEDLFCGLKLGDQAFDSTENRLYVSGGARRIVEVLSYNSENPQTPLSGEAPITLDPDLVKEEECTFRAWRWIREIRDSLWPTWRDNLNRGRSEVRWDYSATLTGCGLLHLSCFPRRPNRLCQSLEPEAGGFGGPGFLDGEKDD